MKLIRNILATAGIAAGAYLFLVSPDPSRRHVMITDRLAHRGLHDEVIPENSLAAFRAAKQNGLGVELDVQYTLDRKVVVFHDEDLLRMCGVDRKVRDMTYEELSELRLHGTDEKIPLFSEVLEVMSPLPVLCELCAPLVKVGGAFAALKSHAEEEVREAAAAAALLGLDAPAVIGYELPGGDARTLVVYRKTRPTPAKYPRRYAEIAKQPLA